MNYREKLYSSYATAHTGQKLGDMRPYKNVTPVFDYRIKHLLPKNMDARCLDIACGSGTFLYYLKSNGYQDLTGIDISPEQVFLAKQVCEDVHEGDTMQFLSAGHKYDLITIFSFIEHLTRDEAVRFLDAVYEALNPEGRLIIITPNADSPFASHMRYGDVTHEVIYNQGALSSLLKSCRFSNCRAYETGPVPQGIVSVIRWLLWQGIKSLLKLYRLIEGGNAGGWIFTTEFIMTAEKKKVVS
ncbi:MAG: class I SAM-dependent methyltransferase [Candidatus Berkelbacteria bacterium]|nr:class I SAM-dependent methyltransferase [Candidatus Berkelbacteria bacterium]